MNHGWGAVVQTLVRALVIEDTLTTPIAREPLVRVGWFIRNDETAPHLVTASPLEESNDEGT